MLNIGRYWIGFGQGSGVPTKIPTTVRRFLFLRVMKEARPQDVDKDKKFPLNTPMEYGGRTYRYWRQG